MQAASRELYSGEQLFARTCLVFWLGFTEASSDAQRRPVQPLSGQWPSQNSNGLRLEATLVRPNGFVAQQAVLTWQNPQQRSLAEHDLETGNNLSR